MTRRVGRNFGVRGRAAAKHGGSGERTDGATPPPVDKGPFALVDLPPLWLLGFAVAAFLLSAILPIYRYAPPFDGVWTSIGGVLIVAALGVALWSAITFARAKTSVLPHENPATLVAWGPYAWSRNPIYLADVALLTGWCMLLGALTPFLLIVPFARLLEWRFIGPEEARLEAAFPEAWADWSKDVRRWF